jgi:hypothetical protein
MHYKIYMATIPELYCSPPPPTWHYNTQGQADQEVQGPHVVRVPIKVDLWELRGKLEHEAVP